MTTRHDFIDEKIFVNLTNRESFGRLHKGDVALGRIELKPQVYKSVIFPMAFVHKFDKEISGKNYEIYTFALDMGRVGGNSRRIGIVRFPLEKEKEVNIRRDDLEGISVSIIPFNFPFYHTINRENYEKLKTEGDELIERDYILGISTLRESGIITEGEIN